MKTQSDDERFEGLRAEDLDDLRDLKEAIQRNGDKPLIPWAQVRRDLELE